MTAQPDDSTVPFRPTTLMASLALVFAAPSVGAQSAAASDPGAQMVVVTATKRLQNLQDVSASVTALGENELEQAGIVDPTRLELVVPGLRVGYSGTEGRFAIRGARTNNVGPQAQQVVGVFNDGAYAPTVGQVLASYLDVSRIEVLRGPQGTLYGRNTFAGAINVISNQPDFDELSGTAQALLGSYQRARAQAVVNLPVSPTFALRLAALSDKHDGYITNTFLDGPADDLRDENVQVGRITARWKPSKTLDATLRLTSFDRDVKVDSLYGYTQIGCYRNAADPSTSTGRSANSVFVPGHCFRPGPDSAASTGTTGASRLTDVSPYNISRDGPSRAKARGHGLNLQVNADLGFATLTLVGAEDRQKSVQFYDPDYSDGYHYGQFGQDSLNNFFAGYDNDQKSRSLEVRLASNGEDRLKWLLGAYFFKQRANWDFGYLSAGRYTRYGTSTDTFDATSKAVLANASFDITKNFRVLGGLRSNDDGQKLIGGADGGGGRKTLWRAGAEYNVHRDLMLYATASTGYRVGGVNGSQLVAADAPAVFGPETVTAYELGFKSQFMQRTVTLNGALFNNRYRNMHAQSFLTACLDPKNPASCIASEFTSNGGAVDAKGLELELNWRPDRRLFVTGGLSLLDATFGNYLVSRLNGLGNFDGRQDVTRTSSQIVAAGGVPSLQLQGWRPALSPKFTATVQGGYKFNVNEQNTVTPVVLVSHTDKYWSFDYNVPGSEQKAFTKLDLRLTWRNEKRGLSIEGFIENATNRAVLVRSVIFAPDEANVPTASIQSNYGDPRTFGVKLSLDF